ncbi:unnamed protein product [Rotaria sordida]|uniref:F-box domain-containing protein n=1 Tax=Rotaria sordida TaxID=392033 RepID=A0A815FXR9_9BILA|nr:unnamed protein product [Rotaria sordida]
MISTFESLPNEILFIIFCNITWSDLLICFWPLNKRLDILMCSVFSRINKKQNNGLVFIEPDLSFKKCYSTLLPLIYQLSFSSSIRRIHFDRTNLSSCDLIYEWLFDNKKKTLRFSNVKSLILTRCLLVKPLIHILPFLHLINPERIYLYNDIERRYKSLPQLFHGGRSEHVTYIEKFDPKLEELLLINLHFLYDYREWLNNN